MVDTWRAGFTLIFIFLVIIVIPCILISILGSGMLNKLAYFPSKNPSIQLSILGWLILIELFAVTALVVLYQVLSA